MKTMIWAHRGASGKAPENTMEAFELAYETGADGIELDVHLTSDNNIVVAHDETIDRCSDGTGRIIDMTLPELRQFDFSNGVEGYRDIRIPTLDQVLEFVKKTDMSVNVEIKSGILIYQGIEEKLVKMVSDMKLSERVIFSSFNHYSLMLIRKAYPKAKIGLLYNEAMIDPHIYAKHLNADAIHPFYPTLLVPGVIEGCKDTGIRINAWTVDNPDHIAWLLKEEIDGIISNYPDIAVKVREEIQFAQ